MTRRKREPKLHDIDLGPDAEVSFRDAWVVVRKVARKLVWLFARRSDGSGKWTTNPDDAIAFDDEADASEVATAVDGQVQAAPPPEAI